MEEEVRDAVFGNVGTMIIFRVGAFDAEVLEKEFAPTFLAADLVNLGFAQVYLKLMIDGVSSQPFSATTMGPISRPEISFKDAVIKSSRDQFARSRAEVEKKIVDWHDMGTAREIKSQSEHNIFQQKKAEEHHRKPNSLPNILKSDENKQVFMKVAEELRQREKVKETISLSSLQPNIQREKDKKIPTKENISGLKDALSSVISKSKQDESKIEKFHGQKPDYRHEHKQEIPEDVLRNLLK